ncbi:methylmalonyl-CoA mutase family protein [Streptomyces sp. NPDC046275]|uniref:methylmalonyl-CoA mutase family protein n=1 Tax=Streptomyces sp. NPDC046275 TaxID=3157201 RepID=UPI0033E4E71B
MRRTDVLLRRAHPASPYESRLDGRFRALAAAGRCALVLTAPRPPAPRPPAARPPASGPPGDCAGGRAALALRQAERLAKLRAWRCHERVGAALILLGRSARGPGEDVLGPMCEALEAGASVGEVSAVLRAHWGGDRRPPPGPGGWGRLLPRPPDPIKETELNM